MKKHLKNLKLIVVLNILFSTFSSVFAEDCNIYAEGKTKDLFKESICLKLSSLKQKKSPKASVNNTLEFIKKTYLELVNIEQEQNNICNFLKYPQTCQTYVENYKLAIILQQMKESGAFGSKLSNESLNFSSIKYEKLQSRIASEGLSELINLQKITETKQTEDQHTFAKFISIKQSLEAYLVLLFSPIQYRDGPEEKYLKCFNASKSYMLWADNKKPEGIPLFTEIKNNPSEYDQEQFLNCIGEAGYAASSHDFYRNYGKEAFASGIYEKLNNYLKPFSSIVKRASSAQNGSCTSNSNSQTYGHCQGFSSICLNGSWISKQTFCKKIEMRNACPNVVCN